VHLILPTTPSPNSAAFTEGAWTIFVSKGFPDVLIQRGL
jgi:hypothetical protein